MKKFILIIPILFLLPLVLGVTVTRTISSVNANVNEEITISLNVVVEEGDDVYSIQETIPSGIEVVDLGGGILTDDKLRWIKHSNIESTSYSYNVKSSSSGTYVFNGEYAFNNQGLNIITGDSTLVVSGIGGGSSSGSSSGSSGNIACSVSWTCTDWSVCINNEKTRTCRDENNCGTTVNKPSEKIICSGEGRSIETPLEKTIFDYFIIGLIIVLVFVIVLIIKRRKNL